MRYLERSAGDSLSLYLREIGRVALLSGQEEQACARRAAEGDQGARAQLIQANLRFVVLVAKQYRNCGLSLEDLISEGNIGLIRAAERFDPERGVRFTSFAVWWIRQAVRRAVRRVERQNRLPGSGRAGEPAHSWQEVLSLDCPAHGSEDGSPFGATLADRSVPRPDEVLVAGALREELGGVLGTLSKRERAILRDRFGLSGNQPVSLLEAAASHGLSRERVRQIERRALRKLRSADAVAALRSYAA